MMKRVHEDRLQVLDDAIRRWSKRETNEIFHIMKYKNNKRWTLTWHNANVLKEGGVDTVTAREFARKIGVLSDLIDMLNRNNYKFMNEGWCDPEIPTDERMKECERMVRILLMNSQIDMIEEWLNNGSELYEERMAEE